MDVLKVLLEEIGQQLPSCFFSVHNISLSCIPSMNVDIKIKLSITHKNFADVILLFAFLALYWLNWNM